MQEIGERTQMPTEEKPQVVLQHTIYLEPSEAQVLLEIADGRLTKGLKSRIDGYIDRLLKKQIGVLRVDGERSEAVTTVNLAVAQVVRFRRKGANQNWRVGQPPVGVSADADQWLADLKAIAGNADPASPAPAPPVPPAPSPANADDDLRKELLTLLLPLVGQRTPAEVADLLTERVVERAADAVLEERAKKAQIETVAAEIAALEARLTELTERKRSLETELPNHPGRKLIDTLADRVKAVLDAQSRLDAFAEEDS